VRYLRVAAAALALGAGILAVLPSSAGADTPYQAAWWSRLQVTVPAAQLAAVPPPPNVPDGGLYVAGSSSSPAALAALRYALDGPVGGTLTLKVANGSATGAVIDACAVTGSWSAGGNQDFATAPTYDCAQKATGVVDATGSSITWEIPAALFRPDAYAIDIALLPGGGAASQVAFAAPDDTSFTHPPVEAAAADGPLAEPSTEPALSTTDAGVAGSVAPLDTARPSFDLGAPAPPAEGGGTPAAAAPAPAAAPSGLPATPASVLRPGDSRSERVGAVAGMLLLAGALWWLGGRPARAPRLIGGAAAGGGSAAVLDAPVDVRGIGRFARLRTGRANRL
jgi:hypothetical protein